MKNAFLRLLRYLNLVARKEDPLVSANTPDFMRSVVSDSLGDNGHWKLIEAVNDSNFDVSKPIGEAAKDAGYRAIPFNLTDGGSIHHIPGAGSIRFRGRRR